MGGGRGGQKKKNKRGNGASSGTPGRKSHGKKGPAPSPPPHVSQARAGSRASTAVVADVEEETAEHELARFREALSNDNLGIRDVARDGNCFFSALSDQLFGTVAHAADLRAKVCDVMQERAEDFAPFVAEGVDHAPDDTESPPSPSTSPASVASSNEDDELLDSFHVYIDRLRRDGAWAGHLEAQATSLLFEVNIRIHQLDRPNMEITNFSKTHQTINMSYHQQEHYASVRPLTKMTGTNPLVDVGEARTLREEDSPVGSATEPEQKRKARADEGASREQHVKAAPSSSSAQKNAAPASSSVASTNKDGLTEDLLPSERRAMHALAI